MEFHSSEDVQADKSKESTQNEVAEDVKPMMDTTKNEQPEPIEGDAEMNKTDFGALASEDASGDVNMEATITADDVLRAGGLGARDDISSLLPVATDFTDFEASLLDAREYEDSQQELGRPGLGWTGEAK